MFAQSLLRKYLGQIAANVGQGERAVWPDSFFEAYKIGNLLI